MLTNQAHHDEPSPNPKRDKKKKKEKQPLEEGMIVESMFRALGSRLVALFAVCSGGDEG